MKKHRILITGIAGFIGSNLAEYLHKNTDFEVFGVDDLSFGVASNVPEGVMWWNFDVRDFAKADAFKMRTGKELSEFNTVIHCATVNIIAAMDKPDYCHSVNVMGLAAIALAFDGLIINLSTSSVYGNEFEGSSQRALAEASAIRITNDYALSKYVAETFLALATQNTSITLRLSNVYGPKQRPDSPYSGVIGKFLGSILNNEPVEVIGDGRQTRDFTYVDDVCRAILICLSPLTARNEVYNVGTATETSINTLIKTMTQVVDEAVTIATIPRRKIDNVNRRCISHDKLSIESGWAPIVSLEEGLMKTYAWMKSYKR